MKDKPSQGSGSAGSHRRKTAILIVAILGLLALFVIFVMVLNSRKPGTLEVGRIEAGVEGSRFVRTNQALIGQMLDNWLPNDLFWPTIFLDNMPNYQIGELEVVRYNVRVLRDNLSRMRTTDKLDPDAEAAFTSLSNDPYKWWFPSAESKWKLAHKKLESYHRSLVSGDANFYPRADNLVELLSQYASLMGGVNTRLMNAPGDIHTTLTLDESEKEKAPSAALVNIDIPWHEIDDNFYYAQGVAYALHESFKAIRVDFMDVLQDKNSLKLVDKILENLGRCDFEPLIVTNGDPDSIFANHSLNLSGVFNDARQKIDSLIVSLKQG
ncbi:MAG: DUF2333 family protein [Deltaproteobacteria bacterium]|nr:DUF2333 family protein [Deltaproteobacteria bacterium]